MKKSFLKFGFILTLVCSITIFSSCEKKKSTTGGGGSSTDVSLITATNIINGTNDIKTVKAGLDDDIIAQTSYQNNGFTLQLPTTLNDIYLYSFSEWDSEISISDKTAKYSMLDCMYAYDIDDDEIGDFWYEYEKSNEWGAIGWMYVDKNVTINGSETYENESLSFDLNLQKGWNILYYVETETYTGDSYYWEYTYTSQKPSGVTFQWYFYSWNWKTQNENTKKPFFKKFNHSEN